MKKKKINVDISKMPTFKGSLLNNDCIALAMGKIIKK
jgi:hypothetical protein